MIWSLGRYEIDILENIDMIYVYTCVYVLSTMYNGRTQKTGSTNGPAIVTDKTVAIA